MIKLVFVQGSSMRTVIIDGRKISMISPETGNKPISMDLDKLDHKDLVGKMSNAELNELKIIQKLETEEDMAEDIKRDFQRTGWRLVKKV